MDDDVDVGYFYGAGIGLGVFSSVFASAGCFLFLSSWAHCCGSSDWGPLLLGSVLFRSVFSLPFMGVPLIMYFSMRIWLTPVVAYSITLCIGVCAASRWKVRNPLAARPTSVAMTHDQTANATAKPPRNTAVYLWLNEVGLADEYHDIFVKEGYETAQDMMGVTEEDLRKLGITKHLHVKKILNQTKAGQTTTDGARDGYSDGHTTEINVHHEAAPFVHDYEDMKPAMGEADAPPPAYDEANDGNATYY